MKRHGENLAIPYSALILDFQSPELRDNTFLLNCPVYGTRYGSTNKLMQYIPLLCYKSGHTLHLAVIDNSVFEQFNISYYLVSTLKN